MALTGTADDATLTLLGVPNSADVDTRFPLTNVTKNTPRFSRYKTVEASVNKRLSNRWSLQAGGSHTWARDFPGTPVNPTAIRTRRTARSMSRRRAGTSSCRALYEGPFGIRFSPLVRHQAGANFARQIWSARAAPPRPARSSAARSTSSR